MSIKGLCVYAIIIFKSISAFNINTSYFIIILFVCQKYLKFSTHRQGYVVRFCILLAGAMNSKIVMNSKLMELISLALPIIFTAFLTEVNGVITLYFVGRIDGAKYIGAATLGNMMCNITGYSIMFGMCSALDTLASQAFGAKEYKLMGLYTQRAMVILTCCSIPIILMWSQTGVVLVMMLGIDEATANLASVWARILALGLCESIEHLSCHHSTSEPRC